MPSVKQWLEGREVVRMRLEKRADGRFEIAAAPGEAIVVSRLQAYLLLELLKKEFLEDV